MLPSRHRAQDQDEGALAEEHPHRLGDHQTPKDPSLPAITVSATKVGSKTAERAKRIPAPTRAIGPVPLGRTRLRRVSRRHPGAHEAPAHQSHPQQGFDERHGSVSGGEDAPVDLGHSRTDGQGERRPQYHGTDECDQAEEDHVAFSGAGGEGPGHNERTRGVQPGQPQHQGREQKRNHPLILSLFTRVRGMGILRTSPLRSSEKLAPVFGADWILRGATRCPRIGGADPRQHGSSRGS